MSLLTSAATNQGGYRRAHADAFAVVFGGKHRRVGFAFRREFAGFAAVAVQAVEPKRIEFPQEPLAHHDERRIAQIGKIGNITDDAQTGLFRDAPFGQTEEPDVKIVEVELLDAPFLDQAGLVRINQTLFLLRTDAREGVVRRITHDDENGFLLFHLTRARTLCFQLRPVGELGIFPGKVPAGQRVGQENSGAFALGIIQRHAQILQEQTHLQVRHDKRRGHDFKTEDAFLRGFLHREFCQCAFALFLVESLSNDAQHLDHIRAGAAGKIEHEHARVGEAVGNVQFLAQRGVHAGDLILHNLRRRIPHAQLLAEFGVEGFEERFVEILDGVRVLKFLKEHGAFHAVERSGSPI